jgi:DMSO/TMAO reductase YedYZ molybdopterin-dependent catalytic subunit
VRTSGKLTTKPWTVKVDGLVDKPGDYSLEDLIDFKNSKSASIVIGA